MTEIQETNDIAKEILCLLSCFDKTFTSKIPEKVLNELRKLAEKSNRIVNIDRRKSLKEQNILLGTKDMIALLYYNYIASEEEKKKIIKVWNENENIYQEELRKKYNIDEKLRKTNNTKQVVNTAMTEYKKGIFQNLFEKIKKILNL